ncbi:NAD(P)/FAD-dependent oxidoreductase [Candidatus Uhrbacteria bacterium]|nr:NAD(P)/FAD-dependent oxidoreductase [Candidatus Uhrbacteria bacterium]
MQHPILILGAGYGGLCLAKELSRRRAELGGAEIFLIDQNEHFLYTPLLYEVATGYDPGEAIEVVERETEKELIKGAAIPYAELIKPWKGVRFRNAEVTGLDWQRRESLLAGGERLPWEYLVIALGSETDFYDIPGLKEQACQLKTSRQALAIRRRLHSLIFKKSKGEEAHLSVVIGGAGATGIEFAAELLRFFQKSVRRGLISWSDLTISVVEASNRLLPQFHKKFSAWARQRLEHGCLKFYFDTCVRSAEAGRVILAPRPLKEGERREELLCEFGLENERVVEVDVLIWTGGVRAASALGEWGFSVDRKGRVAVDEFCRVPDREGVYVIGDCAALSHPRTKQAAPAMAQAAMKEAHAVAENIIRSIHKRPLYPYPFPYLHSLVPLGGKYALADVNGWKFRGFFAWLVRQAADLRYFLHILSPSQAWRLWLHGLRVFGRND